MMQAICPRLTPPPNSFFFFSFGSSSPTFVGCFSQHSQLEIIKGDGHVVVAFVSFSPGVLAIRLHGNMLSFLRQMLADLRVKQSKRENPPSRNLFVSYCTLPRSVVFVLIRIDSDMLLAVAVTLQRGRLVVQTLWVQFRTSEAVHVRIVLTAKSSVAVRAAGETRLPFRIYLYQRGNSLV